MKRIFAFVMLILIVFSRFPANASGDTGFSYAPMTDGSIATYNEYFDTLYWYGATSGTNAGRIDVWGRSGAPQKQTSYAMLTDACPYFFGTVPVWSGYSHDVGVPSQPIDPHNTNYDMFGVLAGWPALYRRIYKCSGKHRPASRGGTD